MKLFVWDLHGVLEKGNDDAVIVISNAVLEQHGYTKRFTMADCKRLNGKKWWEYFADLLPEESHERHLVLQEACFAYDNAHFEELFTKHIFPNDHALHVLQTISRQHEQILISNTRPRALEFYLQHLGIGEYFVAALAVDAHSNPGRTKPPLLARYLEDKDYDAIVIIGDSASDMDLRSVAGGKTYLYSRPEKQHRECESDVRITDLRDVLKEL